MFNAVKFLKKFIPVISYIIEPIKSHQSPPPLLLHKVLNNKTENKNKINSPCYQKAGGADTGDSFRVKNMLP